MTTQAISVQWWAALPFVILLLCIAALPLIPATEAAWERNRVKLAVALACGLPVAIWFVVAGEGLSVVHALVEYGQFICLLFALFVVSGGIFLRGDIRATPRANTTFLAIGGLAASFIGTTGAAMLLIRPLLNTNREREHKVHTFVFAIFIVANCGGLLTPLGDPPLFLGFLRGVPFEWTFGLWPQWVMVNAMLLVTYYALDRRAYAAESAFALAWDEASRTRLSFAGKTNFLFLLVVILGVAFVPSLDLHAIESGHAGFVDWVPWRELVFLTAAGLSYFVGNKHVRFQLNGFTWAPILEVAALFIGIFLAMIPALKYLGQIAPGLPLNTMTFFAFTGALSAFLDNAPTYVTFFEMAAQLPGEPRVGAEPGVPEAYLVAISLGAVLCGAMTYIGNGPNFMVKAVADNAGVRMPTFGGYLWWSLRYLLPTLIAMALVFLTTDWVWRAVGIALAIGLVVRALWLANGSAYTEEAAPEGPAPEGPAPEGFGSGESRPDGSGPPAPYA